MGSSRVRGFSVTPEKLAFVEQKMCERGINSYEALAGAADLSPDVIKKLFSGGNVDRSTVEAIAKTLGIQSTELVDPDRWYRRSKTAKSQALKNIDWQDVCRSMLDRQRKLSTNAVIASEAMQFDLLNDEIFVSLALVERKETDRLSQDVHPARSVERYEEKPPIEYETFREQVLRQGQSDCLAIIGEPGAGKTTLLQHIAFWILDQGLGLPIWISLGDLIKNGNLQRLKDYLTQVWLEDAIPNVTQDVKSDFLEQLNKQRLWLLLDGVDEIVASSGIALYEINHQLRGWLSQVCILLTCRLNTWEVGFNALRDFQTYRTKEFHYPTQVEQFIESGFRKSDQPSGERLKTELGKTERARLQQLVRNPLRLMMLCTTWHEQESLPATKAELYERFVREFYKWNQAKWRKKDLNYSFFPNTKSRQENLNQALGRLSCRALDKEPSPFRLPHSLVFDELGDPDEDGSNFWLALNLGWLQVARNSDKPSEKVYTFFHPTFQEYFAALAIDNRQFLLNHVPEKPTRLGASYRVFEPQWREVALLWLGISRTPKHLKEEIFVELRHFQDDCIGFYSIQAHFLMAEGIREFREYPVVESEKVISNIVKYAFGYFDEHRQKWCCFLQPIRREARRIIRHALEPQKVKNALLYLLDNCPDSNVCWDIANTLEMIGISNKKIRKILRTGATSTLQPHVAKYADWLSYQIKMVNFNNSLFKADKQVISENNNKFNVFEDDLYISMKTNDLLRQIQISDDWLVVVKTAEHLQNRTKLHQLVKVVQSLKPCVMNLRGLLTDEVEMKHFRYEYIFETVWNCTLHMSYADFHQAWHTPSTTAELTTE